MFTGYNIFNFLQKVKYIMDLFNKFIKQKQIQIINMTNPEYSKAWHYDVLTNVDKFLKSLNMKN